MAHRGPVGTGGGRAARGAGAARVSARGGGSPRPPTPASLWTGARHRCRHLEAGCRILRDDTGYKILRGIQDTEGEYRILRGWIQDTKFRSTSPVPSPGAGYRILRGIHRILGYKCTSPIPAPGGRIHDTDGRIQDTGVQVHVTVTVTWGQDTGHWGTGARHRYRHLLAGYRILRGGHRILGH